MELEEALVDAAELFGAEVREVDALECPVLLGVGQVAYGLEEIVVREGGGVEVGAGVG